jgi:large subunit ribosomal protein L23
MRWRRVSNEQMSIDPRHYDVIIAPVITEKATNGVGAEQGRLQGRRDATKPQIKAAVEKLFDVKVKSVNTLVRKGKIKVFRGIADAERRQEGGRHPRRGPVDRRDDGL